MNSEGILMNLLDAAKRFSRTGFRKAYRIQCRYSGSG